LQLIAIMDRFIECFDIAGRYVLVSQKEVVYYEVIMDDENNFVNIDQCVWKFVLKCGGEEGFTHYIRYKVDLETVKRELVSQYNDYVVYDEIENGLYEIRHMADACRGLKSLKKSLLKLQFILFEDVGVYAPLDSAHRQ